MSVCVLVASGLHFDVDAYLQKSRLQPATIFRKGEVPAKESVRRPDSGFVVIAAEGELPQLLSGAMQFLHQHASDLAAMKRAGVDNVLFDFGLERKGALQESHYLPPELIARMSAYGMGMIVSSIQLPRG